jgi:ATP-dependent RNA helicase DHX8/PRP22
MKSLGPAVPELIILPVYSALPSEMQVGGFVVTTQYKICTTVW